MVVSLVGTARFFGWRCWRPCSLKTCAKANNHGLTGMARCNKCRSELARDAPRGRRSIYAPPKNSRHAPTSPTSPSSRKTFPNLQPNASELDTLGIILRSLLKFRCCCLRASGLISLSRHFWRFGCESPQISAVLLWQPQRGQASAWPVCADLCRSLTPRSAATLFCERKTKGSFNLGSIGSSP